ncbi:cysteine-rich receptor-like protein kinase 25 [Silene latifolia]|uniref:cysteine-rich receptor-like protein kinase 25 n=1 Tax=Silene latifolia TaxID=37657 RepID=UPI003D784C00
MYQNNNLFAFFRVIILILITMIYKTTSMPTRLGQYCSNTTMFANGSTYQTNLNTVFRNLVSNATNNPSGFYRTTVGNPTIEVVYGQYLCRGDQNMASCHQCVVTATTVDLPKTYCPNGKTAVIWYDECMVRYSNVSFFNTMDQSPAMSYKNGNNITGNSTQFMEILGNMMNNVIAVRAPEGGPLKKFAVDKAYYSIFETIYGLGQCTPDLSRSDCDQCLVSCFDRFDDQSRGFQIMTPSCLVRYELYPFFNLSFLPQSPPSPSIASSSNPVIMPSRSKGKLKVSTKVLVSIIAALLVFSVALFSICIYLLRKKAKKVEVVTNVEIVDQDFSAESLQYDLQTILTATNNFSDENKLGEGGFGRVYKGTLSDGQLIAVKRLSRSTSRDIQAFKTEVLVVAKLQHRNLARLLGFCYTDQAKLLVYEYFANKSLENFLFDHENRRQLDWQRRYNIIVGIARGLLYLHHESQFRIIHRDLKASNILLDEEMNPKISDFGTSRIFGADHSQSNYTNTVVGTHGYMAPEYAFHGRFTIKSDVYSFGVLVLEIICGRKNSSFSQASDANDILTNAWKHWEAGTPLEFVDPTIRDSCSNASEVMRCIQIALLCVQQAVGDRPTMANVVLTLDSHSITLPLPEQSSFTARPRVQRTVSNEIGSYHSSNKPIPVSVNDVSISEPEAR